MRKRLVTMKTVVILSAILIAIVIIILATPATAQHPPPSPTQHNWYRYQGAPDSKCNLDCGPTSVAMAIQFATGVEVRIEDIREFMTDGNCVDTGIAHWSKALNQDKWMVNDEEITGMSIEHRKITGMEAVVRAINDWHIVIVPVRMHTIDQAEDADGKEDDPKYYKDRYVTFSDSIGNHVLVVKGVSIDNEGNKWVIVYDPNVWGESGELYYYSNGEPKGKDRYYNYDQFEEAFRLLGNEAIEIQENPNSSGGCTDYTYSGVVLFDSDGCGGSKHEILDLLDLTNLSDIQWDNRAQSIHIDSGWSVKVYQHEGGRGESECVTRSLWDLLWDLSNVRFENSDILLSEEISSIEVFYDIACGKGLVPVLYERSEFPILEPGEKTEIYFTLLNTGSQTWEAGHYTLKNITEPLGADLLEMAISEDVPSGSPFLQVPWPFSIIAPTKPDVYRTEWRFSYDGHPIGPLLWIDVIVVPHGSDDLAEIIDAMIEKARREGEELFYENWEKLRLQIIELIEAETKRRAWEIWRKICPSSTTSIALSFFLLWFGRRRLRVGNDKEH